MLTLFIDKIVNIRDLGHGRSPVNVPLHHASDPRHLVYSDSFPSLSLTTYATEEGQQPMGGKFILLLCNGCSIMFAFFSD